MPKVKFDLADADDLFEDEGAQQVNEPEEKDEPEQQASSEEDTEQTDTKEEEPPKQEAAPEQEADDIPPPPTEAPSDPAYMLAQARQQMYEQEARNRELAERLEQMANPPDQFEQEERQLTDKRNTLRQQAMDALREGDEVRRQQLMWELQDTEQALLDSKSNRSMKEITALRTPQQQQQDQRRITPEQEQYIQTETFKAAYRVTPEESYAMDDAWRKLLSRNPNWNDPNVPRWSKMEQALRIVRNGKKGQAQGHTAAMVAGDQSNAPKKPKGVRGRYPDKVLADMARSFEMTVDQYVQMIDGGK